ncbi:MAG: Mfa1 family fimbria major subunit [Tannerellaceae bacterium]|jgi:hypothetical protein|nr:Mfa1 family fimbria major subunit [Tannerellaceae bacterium]
MMKKNLLSFLFAAVAAAFLSSCSVKETPVSIEEETPEPTSDATYMTLDVNIEGETKAPLTSDENETSDIAKIRLLIYAHAGDNSGICEIDTNLTTTSTRTSSLKVSPGAKRIFVIANEPGVNSFLSGQVGRALTDLIGTKTETSGNKLFLHEIDFGTPLLAGTPPAALTALNYSSIVTPKMVFCNSQATSSSIFTVLPDISLEESQSETADASKNHFTIPVQRVVAKVTVNNVAASMNINAESLSGGLSNLFWGVRNQNRAVALFKETGADGKVRSPLYNVLAGLDLTNVTIYKPYWWTGDQTGVEINLTVNAEGDEERYYYVPENVFGTMGNSTYIAAKASFIPAANNLVKSIAYDEEDGVVQSITSIEKGTTTAPATFYRINPASLASSGVNYSSLGSYSDIEGLVFAKQDDATLIACMLEHSGSPALWTAGYTPEKLKIDTYTNGVCYYRFNISDNTDGGLLRNKQYLGRITEFTKLGFSRPDELDEIPTVAQSSTHASATILILPWETVTVDLK